MILLPVATLAAGFMCQAYKPMPQAMHAAVSVPGHVGGLEAPMGMVQSDGRAGSRFHVFGVMVAGFVAGCQRYRRIYQNTKRIKKAVCTMRATSGSDFALADGREVKILADRETLQHEIASQTASAAREALAEKGDFSICIPGGFGPADGRNPEGAKLIGEALQSLSTMADLNFSHWHVFFAGSRLDGEESYLLAKQLWLDACKIPTEQVHPVPQDIPAEGAAATYTAKICMQDENVMKDSPDGLPALDLLLLDMDSDGSVGRLLPGSPELDEAGTGKLILPVEDEVEAAIASLDFMNAACRAILVGGGRPELAKTVADALGTESPNCPASLIRPAKTLWLLDADSGSQVQR